MNDRFLKEWNILKEKKNNYLRSLYVFSSFLCSSIRLDYSLVNSMRFSDMLRKLSNPRWPPFGHHNVITTSHHVLVFRWELKGNIFERVIYPPGITGIALIKSESWRQNISPSSLPQATEVNNCRI